MFRFPSLVKQRAAPKTHSCGQAKATIPSLGQTVNALAKSFQIYWDAHAFLGGLENNESSRLAGAKLV